MLIPGQDGEPAKELLAQAIPRGQRTDRWPLCRREYRRRAGKPCSKWNSSVLRRTPIPVRNGGRDGKFKLADGGTLFLDEIGDMSLALQACCCAPCWRKLTAGRSEPVDDRRCADRYGNQPEYGKMVADGRFRRPLLSDQRHHLRTPPLRERLEDFPCSPIIWLIRSAATRACHRAGSSAGAINRLCQQ